MRHLALLTALLLALPAAAKPPTLRAKVDVETSGDFRLVHPTRWVHVSFLPEFRYGGDDRRTSHMLFRLIDVAAAAAVKLEIPLDALYAAERAGLYLAGPTRVLGKGRVFSTFDVRLLGYDPDQGRAVLLIDDGAGDRHRVHAVGWDLAKSAPTWTTLLGEGDRGDDGYYAFLPLGPTVDGAGIFVYGLSYQASGDGFAGKLLLRRLAVASGAVDWQLDVDLAPVNEKGVFSIYTGADAALGRLVLAEYSESAFEDKKAGLALSRRPQLYVVDVAKSAVTALPAPYTPYGIALEGDTLVVGSNESCRLYRYDLTKPTAKPVETKSACRTQRLVLRDKELLVLGNLKQAEVRAWPGLKRTGLLTASKLVPGLTGFAPSASVVTLDGKTLLLPTSDARFGIADSLGAYLLDLN